MDGSLPTVGQKEDGGSGVHQSWDPVPLLLYEESFMGQCFQGSKRDATRIWVKSKPGLNEFRPCLSQGGYSLAHYKLQPSVTVCVSVVPLLNQDILTVSLVLRNIHLIIVTVTML